jgi:hypothetical protein
METQTPGQREMTTGKITHADAVAILSDSTIEAALQDLGKRNLSKQQDHETRWLADRSKALRAERRKRKGAGNYHP